MSDSEEDGIQSGGGGNRPKTSLTQLMNAVPERDSIPDSCSEADSDEDDAVPLPLPLPRSGGDKKIPSWLLGSSSVSLSTPISGPSKTSAAGRSTPGLARRDLSDVQTTPGYGGRVVYSLASNKPASYYCVQWRKPQQKKHKTWDGDAWLRVDGNKITMIDEDGKTMGIGGLAADGLPQSGQEFRIGSYDTEVDREVTYEEFKLATSVLNKQGATPVPSFMSPANARAGPSRLYAKAFKTPTQVSKPQPSSGYVPARGDNGEPAVGPSAPPNAVVGTLKSGDLGMYRMGASPKPAGEKIVIGEKSSKERNSWGGALFDPNAEGAVVMQRPPDKWANLKQTSLVDVVIDPDLSCLMRDHQKEGVKFMYSCVMGLTDIDGEGCILADEMGLGKSLQTVALIYTMIKQSPFKNQTSCINKAMIVCPVTLVDNWRKEFRKWVDRRLNVVVADGSNDHQISSFCINKSQHVLIIGYERLRKVIKKLAACVPPIDLIVCDEGHRLKAKDNKTTKMFDELRTMRRIILSGTPLQNDLSEYWAMANFVCPGVLGRYNQFNRQYEKPILKSRAPGCPKADAEEGQMRAQELGETSRAFVLRRDATVLNGYLPPKHEYVVFVAPSKLQLAILDRLLSPTVLSAFLQARMQPLGFIDTLRKVCNSPILLKRKADKEEVQYDEKIVGSALEQAVAVVPRDIAANDASTSGKMKLLERMLREIHRTTPEKVVVVSNWTSTLDIIQEMLTKMRYPYLRLDGSTVQKTRQGLVDQFNRGRREDSFVFLLSAKAGGTGLNLIGASRLIVFDSDWNPSTDLQAMARIHRDGQKRPVYIYRLLTACTIDEKIYQRQITKTGLSDQMLEKATSEKSSNSFSDAELRDLFTLTARTDGCQTHDLLGCDCNLPKLAEKDLNVPASNEPNGDSDSDDSTGQPKFISASQFDPTPPAKMVRKAAQEKRDKLAALKKWMHFDAFDRQSFDGVTDALLHSIVWTDCELGATSAANTTSTSSGPTDSADEFDGIASGADSDDEQFVSRKRRKVDKSKSRSKHGLGIGAEIARRHDLREIADAGGGGRVMFMFEKVSKSKM